MNITVEVYLRSPTYTVEISRGIQGQSARFKTNVLSPSDFVGSPKKATILFDNPWGENYVPMQPVGVDARFWTVEDVELEGYTINTNSDDDITGLVYCATLPLGETT